MVKFNIIHNYSGIVGLSLIEPLIHVDNRGCLVESYNRQEFRKIGIREEFVQDNHVFSKKNVLRGFHINTKSPHSKLLTVISGSIFDVVIDLRKNSPTFKMYACISMDSNNKRILYIPEGFAHAYFANEDTYLQFKVPRYYVTNEEVGFAWNSKEFTINWPNKNPVLSIKDRDNLDYSLCGFEV